MTEIKSELLALLRRHDLLRAALFAGHVQNPEFNDAPFVELVMEMAASIWHLSARSKYDPIKKAEAINRILYKEYGFEGKSEQHKQIVDDPDRYYLHRVLEKKIASPLTLTLLYSIMAEQVGLNYEVLALPSYYLIRIKGIKEEFYIDPFDGGKFLGQEDFQKKFRLAMNRNRILSTNIFERINGSQLIARLIQQLKHIYILKGNAMEALRAVELLTCIFPQSPELTRDRGILYCEMEYFSRAMIDLKDYLKSRPTADDVNEIKKLTTMLKGYREILN
ncbi:MAG: tetratricopeptide repeat protein [Bdellovibrionales bacterium]|nr:tetratricopeptide repeat protein [Bdellovibrionales bacterium]